MKTLRQAVSKAMPQGPHARRANNNSDQHATDIWQKVMLVHVDP
jgi:hypothetical protein